MINILYCGNEAVFDGILISLLSILKYTGQTLHVYVMTMDLQEIDKRYQPITKEQAAFLGELLKEYHEDSAIELIDVTRLFAIELLESPNRKTGYTPYTMLRLFADEITELPDKILYMDTDTVARGDISPVFDIDIEEYDFAGVRDYLGRWFIHINYMNAGILYLNLARIRENGLFKRARQLCAVKRMWFPDQTALNRLSGKRKFMPSVYNEQRRLKNDTVIRHFCKSIRWLPFFHIVNVKPWELERMHKIYPSYAYDDILEEYQTRIKAWKAGEAASSVSFKLEDKARRESI